MVEGGVGLSTLSKPRAAAEQAAAAALAGAGGAQAAMLFAGPGYGDDLSLLLDAAVSQLGTELVAGASAHGVLAQGREPEEGAAVAILAWSGLESIPFLICDARGQELAACQEIAARLGGPPRAEDLVVLLPDPRSFDPAVFFPGLREALGPARVVGAGAGDPLSDAPLQWCGREVASGAIAGMVLRGARPPRIGVTQACGPVTGLLSVTRSRGHWVLEIEGRPALEVYREAARGPLAADLPRAASFLLVAFPADPQAERLGPDSYLVRHVVGFDENENAFALPEPAKPGSRIALVQREREAAREDLKAMLERMSSPSPALGFYFDCCARGARLFGLPGLEAAYLESFFGSAPLAGMFGSCEIGPLGGSTELLTYTGVLALIDGPPPSSSP